jgi:hypothetical protein
MTSFFNLEGLETVSSILNRLLGSKKVDLTTPSIHRTIIEHIAVMYREIGRFYPWKIVGVDGIRHAVILLKFGDRPLKTLA